MQNTPLLRALEGQMAAGRARLHMPGHKGRLPAPLAAAAPYDFTELPGTDSLYEAAGCLRELEEGYAALYGARRTLLSAGGATLCIQAMLALLGPGAGLLCDRNLHTSALGAMGLLDLRPTWLWGGADCHGLPTPPTPGEVAAALRGAGDVRGVYITSPNYYGNLADIGGIAAVCAAHGVPLLVDNAHGAHLRFLSHNCHPLALGAAACCDSLHKTLPALTGAALLHLGPGAPWEGEAAKRCMALFGSTSPSYLIMLSMDLLYGQLLGPLPAALRETAKKAAALRALAGQPPAEGRADPLRLVLPTGSQEAGGRMGRHLRGHGIEPELCDSLAAVLLLSPENGAGDFARLQKALADLPAPAPPRALPAARPARACPVRAAMLAPARRLPLSRAAGHIAAGMVAHCPPGIPLVMCGERLDAAAIFLLESYGIHEVDVVK